MFMTTFNTFIRHYNTISVLKRLDAVKRLTFIFATSKAALVTPMRTPNSYAMAFALCILLLYFDLSVQFE